MEVKYISFTEVLKVFKEEAFLICAVEVHSTRVVDGINVFPQLFVFSRVGPIQVGVH